MSLFEQLSAYEAKVFAGMPEDMKKLFRDVIAGFITSGIDAQALKVGETVPDFELPNHRGKMVRLSELLSAGPLVISFYRGGWCPYCNLEMKALQEKLPEITDLGARLIAITPELPDNAMTTALENAISFDVLSDLGNEVAKAFGLVFVLPEPLQPLYEQFGINLEAINGDPSLTLPIPATYVVETDGTVLAAYVNPDYAKRMEPAAVVDVLDERDRGGETNG